MLILDYMEMGHPPTTLAQATTREAERPVSRGATSRTFSRSGRIWPESQPTTCRQARYTTKQIGRAAWLLVCKQRRTSCSQISHDL